MELVLLFGVLFGLMALGAPIFVAMGGAALTVVAVTGIGDATILPSRIADALSSYELLAIPFFILTGELMNHSGLTERVIRLLMWFLGRMRGGLAYAAVSVNLFASGVSGSAPADASAVSSVMLPTMRREGYRPEHAAAINAAAAVVGPIMPPSIPMIFVALVTNLSVGRLFLGGVGPAILLSGAMLLIVGMQARRGLFPAATSPGGMSESLGRLVLQATPALIAPVIIVGGIILGFATITEVAFIAAAYVLFLGLAVYRTIRLTDVPRIFRDGSVFSSTIMILFGVIGIFTFIVAIQQVGDRLGDLVATLDLGPTVFLLLSLLFFLLVGMVLDAVPAILIFLPVLLPVAIELGVDPIHFGVVVVVNLMIGLLTPPVGALLYVLTKISGVPFGRLSRATFPFVVALIAVLIVVTLVPAFVTWLPNALFG